METQAQAMSLMLGREPWKSGLPLSRLAYVRARGKLRSLRSERSSLPDRMVSLSAKAIALGLVRGKSVPGREGCEN